MAGSITSNEIGACSTAHCAALSLSRLATCQVCCECLKGTHRPFQRSCWTTALAPALHQSTAAICLLLYVALYPTLTYSRPVAVGWYVPTVDSRTLASHADRPSLPFSGPELGLDCARQSFHTALRTAIAHHVVPGCRTPYVMSDSCSIHAISTAADVKRCCCAVPSSAMASALSH